MSSSNPPQGQRFSHVYISHPELLADSTRMRRRLGLLFHRFGPRSLYSIFNQELGTALSSAGSANDYYWAPVMERMELRDVLDGVTIVVRRAEKKSEFLNEVRRVFSEEKVRYSVDAQGGVHFAVDVEFEQVRVAALSRLSSSRYQSVRQHFEAAYQALDGVPPDPKAALRSMFFAVEGLFRLMFGSAHQLSSGEISKHLKPRLEVEYGGQKPAIYVAHKQLAQLSDWVDGAHFYRHEPGTEEPAQPPIDMAVHYVSTGASWLRWLAQLDKPA